MVDEERLLIDRARFCEVRVGLCGAGPGAGVRRTLSLPAERDMAAAKPEILTVAGREVTITNPQKVYFPAAGYTKVDLARYYLAVGEAALRGVRNRPIVLKRYVDGADKPAFYQKRAPEPRPEWVETVELQFPSGRTAVEIVITDLAQLLWIVNLGCIDLHPHLVRAADLEHPDELRIDLDPVPGVPWSELIDVALSVRDVLAEHRLVAWPKTSGSRGIHVNVRIEPRWSFDEVRRAALAVAREVERRMPGRATSAWWKEERQGVFLDYNQNAKDRTTAAAYSVRPTPDARVSTPLRWEELASSDPAAFTLATVPRRLTEQGDPAAEMDSHAGLLDGLLALSAQQAAEGQGDAPWPPHYEKKAAEPKRVAPSRAKGQTSPRPRRGAAAVATASAGPAPSEGAEAPPAPKGRRRPSAPLLTIARAQLRQDALAGLDRWRARHPEVAALLAPADILVDTMRGRSSIWTRVRINLRAVPEAQRPASETPDPDFEPEGAA